MYIVVRDDGGVVTQLFVCDDEAGVYAVLRNELIAIAHDALSPEQATQWDAYLTDATPDQLPLRIDEFVEFVEQFPTSSDWNFTVFAPDEISDHRTETTATTPA